MVKVQRRVSKAERTACTKDYIRESIACLRNFKDYDIARKEWKVKRKKKAGIGERNKGKTVKGFGRLMRPRSAVPVLV